MEVISGVARAYYGVVLATESLKTAEQAVLSAEADLKRAESVRADLLDEKGNLPEIEKPMLVDAFSTIAASLLGTTTTGAYVESATGIAAGGKSGLTAVVVAVLFLSALFFAPFLAAVPAFAYGPALIIVGAFMLSPVIRLKFDDYSEVLPAFTIIVMMSFTYNIGIGMTAGFVVYPLFKLLGGKGREIKSWPVRFSRTSWVLPA